MIENGPRHPRHDSKNEKGGCNAWHQRDTRAQDETAHIRYFTVFPSTIRDQGHVVIDRIASDNARNAKE